MLFTTFAPLAIQKLETEEFLAEKVFKYRMYFDCNCIESKNAL